MIFEDAGLNIPGFAKPICLYSTEDQEWKRAKCTTEGVLLASVQPPENEGAVASATTAGVEVFTGEGWLLGGSNPTTSLVTIYDDTLPVGHILPGGIVSAPVFVTTSLVLKTALGVADVGVTFLRKAIV